MLASPTRSPDERVAIKVIEKRSIKGPPSFYLKREVDIIKQLDHPNICRFLETYMDKMKIYLVMEYCSGGTLKDKFINKQELTEG
jgi:calcium-dependent protein kinase